MQLGLWSHTASIRGICFCHGAFSADALHVATQHGDLVCMTHLSQASGMHSSAGASAAAAELGETGRLQSHRKLAADPAG